jgi:hypothetical protein
MKKLALLLILYSSLFAYDLSSNFTGGSGTVEDPYQISTEQQLQNMNLDLDANYILINDIYASETRHWNDGKGFEPIANVDTIYYGMPEDIKFTGSLNGNNYSISNLFINRQEEYGVGLFGYAITNDIKNLNIEKAYIVGYEYVGSLCGLLEGSISEINLIESCIEGNTKVGGLLGKGISYCLTSA